MQLEAVQTENLFIVTFQDETRAKEALALLKSLHKRKELKLQRGAFIVRYQSGHFEIRETHDLNMTEKKLAVIALVGAIVASFFALPLGPAGIMLGLAIGAACAAAAMGLDLVLDFGFKDSFLRRIEEDLDKGCSALVAQVNFSGANLQAATPEVLRGGTITHHTLAPEIYRNLTRLLEN